jgi:DNA polymerase III sliding clamp (beta) subunit (PCNA family)
MSNGTLKLEEKIIIALPPHEIKNIFKKMLPFIGDETRPYLHGIYCHFEKDKLTFCATNGHILCEMLSSPKVLEAGEFTVIMAANAIKHLIKVLPSTDNIPYMVIKVTEDNTEIEFESQDFNYKFKALDAAFPNYQAMMPEGKIKMRQGMNAEYLMAALKALGNLPVDISIDENEDSINCPHLLTSKESLGIRCVIMPMKVA